MRWKRLIDGTLREAHYMFQKTTRLGFDSKFEEELRRQADEYRGGALRPPSLVRAVPLDSIELTDEHRFVVFKADVYRRFDVGTDGADVDRFGRLGRWVPRGTTVYYDGRDRTFVKLFDVYAATKGEARFLADAMAKGLFDFLCPNLEYLIWDDLGNLRGYAIREGRPLTRFEFERYVGGALREVVLDETARTGYYFNDLEYHNVVLSDGRISIIDLESILPISWFGTDLDFAERHLDEVDVGWPIQSKWCSPTWYSEYLAEVGADELVTGPE